jgi:hypothetical protein
VASEGGDDQGGNQIQQREGRRKDFRGKQVKRGTVNEAVRRIPPDAASVTWGECSTETIALP